MNQEAKTVAVIVLIILIIAGTLLYFPISKYLKRNYAKVVGDIPDPFIFNNGSRVTTEQDWQLRREEIKEMILNIEYGTIPGRPDALIVSEVNSTQLDNGVFMKTLNFSVVPKNGSSDHNFNFTVWVYLPNTPGPHPVVLKVAKDGIGSQVPVNKTIVDRNYVYICFEHVALDPDTEGYDIVGPAQTAYPDYTWGTLAVWAWGAMRVVDYLVHEPWVSASYFPEIEKDKIIITGHSRRGKVSLLAAALDERIKISAPSGSGCGGVGSFKVQGFGAETIALITRQSKFWAWFHKNFSSWGGREAELPFDQHFFISLIAPRYIISLTGMDDLWANPIGTQVMSKAAQPVFDFLNNSKGNARRFREGGHAYLEQDFIALLDFADHIFYGNEPKQDFYMTPYKNPVEIKYSSPN